MKRLLLLVAIVSISCQHNEKETVSQRIHAELLYEIKSLLGEGAFWNHQTQELYWVDIEGKKLHIYNPSSNLNKSFEMPSRIGTVVPDWHNNAIVALEDGVYSFNIDSSKLSVLSNVEKTVTTNRLNDGKCDPNGNLWVGSMHYEQTRPEAKVYKITEEGRAMMMIDSVTISNGIVWTKDQKTMYYIDTPTSQIRAYDYDPENATISNERVAVEVNEKDGYPDGMTIDSEDKLWVGMWNGNAVARYDPVSGKLLSKIEVPAHNVTSCTFGGPDLDHLYITTASIDMTPDEAKGKPLSGSLFVVKPGVRGVPGHFFGVKTQAIE